MFVLFDGGGSDQYGRKREVDVGKLNLNNCIVRWYDAREPTKRGNIISGEARRFQPLFILQMETTCS